MQTRLAIVDYLLLYEENRMALSQRVRELIEKGYEPYGRPFNDPRMKGYSQAMVKYEWKGC